MGKYFTEHVEIEVGLDEWEDEELIEEIKARGYHVKEDADLNNVELYWNQGNKKEALVLLEREFKYLRGISDLVN